MTRQCLSQISYQIERLLGEGLNSRVYLAIRRDNQGFLEQKVALKIFKSKNLDQEFRSEFASLSKVNSKFCVGVYGFENLDDQQGLVLEYVEGTTLRDLALRRVLDSATLYLILYQCRKGLLDLSRQGLFHGDLSPQNILISSRGQVKLIDFGFSNHFTQQRLQATPEFVSPHLLQRGAADFFTDIDSLGEVFRFCKKFLSQHSLGDRTFKHLFASAPQDIIWSLNEDEKVLACRLGRRVQQTLPNDAAGGLSATASLDADFQLKPKSFWIPVKRWGLLIVGACLLFLEASSASIKSGLQVAELHIRTRQWIDIKVNGQHQEDSMQSLVLPPGDVLLEWSRKGALRQKRIRLGTNQKLILEDSFFR